MMRYSSINNVNKFLWNAIKNMDIWDTGDNKWVSNIVRNIVFCCRLNFVKKMPVFYNIPKKSSALIQR